MGDAADDSRDMEERMMYDYHWHLLGNCGYEGCLWCEELQTKEYWEPTEVKNVHRYGKNKSPKNDC